MTFGSFNNFAKVTPQVIEHLARDLWQRVPSVAAAGPGIAAAVRCKSGFETMAASARHRPRSGSSCATSGRRRRYLELMQRADIALDPFPFNGHTTTCDAIWMGVPVVMLAGKTYASRFGGSVLRERGPRRLDCRNASRRTSSGRPVGGRPGRAWSSCAASCGGGWPRSVLLDFAGFTRNLETAYRRMWIDWCAAAVA